MTTTFTYKVHDGSEVDGKPDALVRLIAETELAGDGTAALGGIAPEIARRLKQSFDKGTFGAKPNQSELIATLGLHDAEHIVFVGFIPGSGADGLRHAAATAAKALKSVAAVKVEFALQEAMLSADIAAIGAETAAHSLVEGLLLALHERQPLKREAKERFALEEVALVSDANKAAALGEREQWERGIARGKAVSAGVGYARDLTNLPGNDLTPERLAFYAEELAHEYELDIEVIDEWTAAELGMGALLGVGHGSVNPPRMIVIHYSGDPESQETWGLIGKGITFDTGGISLKRAPGMEEMISDMGGAAAVLGALRVIAELNAPVNVVAVIPAAENMPSDRALKPGDVLRTMSGYTVEVVNTDAEGRLVLADALTTAIQRGATKLVDVATLTGAVMVALGYEATGAVTNNEELMSQVLEASARAGERVWQLPAYPEYMKGLKSNAADLKNSGSRYAAASTGGMFIGHFAEGLPWVHLDIGGTAWLESSRGWEPKGATGVMVKTLVELTTRQ